MNFQHEPVLLKETIEMLDIKEDGIYIDGTIGGAGHSQKILENLNDGILIGLDRDLNALRAASEKIGDDPRVKLFNLNYRDFEKALFELSIDQIDGVLLDIGVSSHQFDEPTRGFSYRFDSKLDMRMDQDQQKSAWDVVNYYDLENLTRIFFEYGEERWAKRIAEFIVESRKNKSIDTTFELVDIIKAAIPKAVRRDKSHPAKKVFQAIRIEVNDELENLSNSIDRFVDRLKPSGRIAIITFHSLEDAIVKRVFKDLNTDCICPEHSPICTCDHRRKIEIITRKPVTASKTELSLNNRSHSAKLRVAKKLEVNGEKSKYNKKYR